MSSKIIVMPCSRIACTALEDPGDDQWCQAKGHLVGHDQSGLHRQGSRQTEHLLLASGETSRPLATTGGQHREQLECPVDGLGPFDVAPGELGSHAEVVHNGQAGKDATAFRNICQSRPADSISRQA